MAQVFISYASEDKAFARHMAADFEARGWSVWWDHQIPPGMDYATVIETAIAQAGCMVVLWSRHSVTSRWVAIEAAEGANRQIAATVIIDDTDNSELPFEFRRLQAVNLSDWRPGVPHEGFEQLVARVGAVLDQPAGNPREVSPAGQPSGRALSSWGEALNEWGRGRQRAYRLSGAITLLLAVGLALFVPAAAAPLGAVLAAMSAVIGLVFFQQGRHPA